jgi:hypothetical protein
MPRELTELQMQILRYVARRSAAAETPAGVNSVWLKRDNTYANVLEVERALLSLVALGHMERHVVPGGAVVFRRVSGGTLTIEGGA